MTAPSDPPLDPHALRSRVVAFARSLGFDAVGIARGDEPLDRDHARYRAFVDAGMHGEMAWLADHADVRRRVDTANILEGAASVICVARRYAAGPLDPRDREGIAPHIARYARGRDYHNFIKRKLRQLAAFVRRLGTAEAEVHARPMCDDAPVLERAWAARAGLGFVGKNGLLIVPGQGSFVLLGEVVTTLRLPPDEPIEERCGACTRCIDACPTQALVKPFVLDARRCVAYLTIEHRSAIDVELRPGVGDHLFGCDDCQTVCPFNASTHRPPPASAATSFAPHERWHQLKMADFLQSGAGEEGITAESPLRRASGDGLARNAAIVLGNLAERGGVDPEAIATVRRAAAEHGSPVVREAATWALARMTAGVDPAPPAQAGATVEGTPGTRRPEADQAPSAISGESEEIPVAQGPQTCMA